MREVKRHELVVFLATERFSMYKTVCFWYLRDDNRKSRSMYTYIECPIVDEKNKTKTKNTEKANEHSATVMDGRTDRRTLVERRKLQKILYGDINNNSVCVTGHVNTRRLNRGRLQPSKLTTTAVLYSYTP